MNINKDYVIANRIMATCTYTFIQLSRVKNNRISIILANEF